MPVIPAPTENDIGKVLSFTADGLQWVSVSAEELADFEQEVF